MVYFRLLPKNVGMKRNKFHIHDDIKGLGVSLKKQSYFLTNAVIRVAKQVKFELTN